MHKSPCSVLSGIIKGERGKEEGRREVKRLKFELKDLKIVSLQLRIEMKNNKLPIFTVWTTSTDKIQQ